VPEPNPGREPRREQGPGKYAGLGIQLVVSILLFVWIGQWADRKLGTGGLMTILGVFIGFGGTMYALMRSLKRDDEGG
jgi:F0F1-type ATP synthase assembly protein I